MQPAPLTGTATIASVRAILKHSRCSPHPSRGQQLAEFDLNCFLVTGDAARAPHGDRNQLGVLHQLLRHGDAACTLHGDRNVELVVGDPRLKRMQLAPLTGTATQANSKKAWRRMMQPAPLTGTATP